MPAPTTGILLNSTTPAAPSGDQNVKPQSDGGTPQQSVSFYPQRAAAALYGTVLAPVSVAGLAVDGGGSAIASGAQKRTIQIPFAGTIVGWAITADQAGSISIDVWKTASSAPPSAPAIPASSNKISASAPPALSSAQSAAAGGSGVSTWTTAVAAWDVFGFDITAASTVTAVTLEIFIQRT